MSPSSRPLACGLDLGGTKLLGVVVDPDGGEPLLVDKVPAPLGVDQVVDGLAGLARALIAETESATGRSVASVGVGAPGLVDRQGTLRYGPNIPGVTHLPLAELLADRLDAAVTVDNDASCAAWAEHEHGAARGFEHSVTVTLGTGIGGGFTVKGELLRGAHGFAGEPGHMVIDPSGPRCPCGRHGCWEVFASGNGLGRQAREAAEAGRAASVVDLAGGVVADIRGEHVTAAAASGAADAVEILRVFGGWVALGIANLVNLLDCEIVVVGGGLVEAGDVLLDPVRAAYAELAMGAGFREDVPVVPAALGERAGAWGAALLADRRR